jgi:type IV pilus assembly protein PilY1
MRNTILFLITLYICLIYSNMAIGQDEPDVRDIPPTVMLLVDTSGSMERMPGDTITFPVCNASRSQRNRWTNVLEALTGTWNVSDFYCTALNRSTGSFRTEPDFRYIYPYHRPPLDRIQNNDGILDVYRDRIRFGLMTFDNTFTFRDPPTFTDTTLVSYATFLSRLRDDPTKPGEFSYGEPQRLTFVDCPTPYMINTGARNENASMGRMIAFGREQDVITTNQLIQTTLLSTRPYGGTPTNSLMDDVRYYYQNHPDATTLDPYRSCRKRYVILITDGEPDSDFRDPRYNCESVDGCPYELASTIASDLCSWNGLTGQCEGVVDGVFVVGLGITNPTSITILNDIAARGGTGSAFFALDRIDLMARLSEALSRAAPATTTRTRPVYINSTLDGLQSQLQFNSGFQISTDGGPWSGILQRIKYICDDSLTPQPEPVSSRIRFDQRLNAQTNRTIYTVITPNSSNMADNLTGIDADAVPLGGTSTTRISDLSLVPFNNRISSDYFNVSGSTVERNARRNYIVDWVYGTTPDRINRKLGDIYHSTPVVVGPPTLDIADESYNLFRRRTEIANRPTILYVGTNDGLLHAFIAEDWINPNTGERLTAGHELWAFVPPVLISKLNSAVNSHQIMLDGSAIVKDVYYRRLPDDSPDGNIYHTVLLMGFRGGSAGYFALDVSNPLQPQFLWQFIGDSRTGSDYGQSYGSPAIGQVLVEVSGVLQERAIVILPGGNGSEDAERVRTTGPVGCPSSGIGMPPNTDGVRTARSRQRCWDTTGRIISWVDIITGEMIRAFDHTTFNAPLNGGVSLYPGNVGSVAQRAYFTDADGVLWAADFSNRNPSNWTVQPIWDIYLGSTARAGQPAYYPPVVSMNNMGNPVVIVGTGDIDNLTAISQNRIISLTENRTFGTSGGFSYTTSLNWEIELRPGEQMTGALELFESKVYFSTFENGITETNACEFGNSRVWAVEYYNSGGTAPRGYIETIRYPLPAFESDIGSGLYDTYFQGPFENQLIPAISLTQRPTCISGGNITDPYIGTRYRVANVNGGSFNLIAQSSNGIATESIVPTINVQLASPQSFVSTIGFASRVD